VTRLADDYRRRGALRRCTSLARIEDRVSWSLRVSCRLMFLVVQERATNGTKRLPLTAVGRRYRKSSAGPTSRRRRHAASLCARLRLGTSPRQCCVGFHHRTHECMYSLDARGVYKVGVDIGATGRGGS